MMSRCRQVAALLGSLVLAVSLVEAQPEQPSSHNTASRPAVGKQGMVCTAHPLATQVGLEILEAGGNAFDATAAVSAALNVVEPMMSGMGGFGVILFYDADKDTLRCLDASGRFPAGTDADLLRAPTANYLQNRKGAKAVSTPGNANAWETLTKAHGKLPWPRLLAPAIKLAAVNKLLGQENRAAMTNRDGHGPTEQANEQVYRFFEWWLKDRK